MSGFSLQIVYYIILGTFSIVKKISNQLINGDDKKRFDLSLSLRLWSFDKADAQIGIARGGRWRRLHFIFLDYLLCLN